jgi:transcriptional regulator with GAF, ATPase, and Fis domain
METNLHRGDPTTPTGQFEFKLRTLLSEDLAARERRHSLTKLLHLVEKNIIVDALERVDGNQKAAGRALGLKYTTFCAKLKRYGIRVVRHFGIQS